MHQQEPQKNPVRGIWIRVIYEIEEVC